MVAEAPPPAPPGDRRLRVSRVVGRTPTGGTRTAIAAPPPGTLRSAGLPADAMDRAPAAFTTVGLVGAAAVVLAILGLILNFVLPWIATEGFSAFGAGDTHDRADVRGGLGELSTYVDRLVMWPVVAFSLMIASGLGLLLADLVPLARAARHGIQLAAGTLGAYAGFLLALTGTRWLGMYVAEVAGEGDASFHLHAVPWINLGLGLAWLAAAGWLVIRAGRYFLAAPSEGRFGENGVRLPAWTAAAAGIALLALPLLPYAAAEDGFFGDTAYLGEFTLDLLREVGDGDPAKPGQDLALARIMLWVALYASLASAAFGLVERTGHLPLLWGTLAQVHAPLGLTHAVGVVFTILYYLDLAKVDDAPGFFGDLRVSLNHLMPLAWVALAAIYALYAVRVLGPYVRSVNAESARTDAAPSPSGPGRI